jgi:ribosome recycling factor
VFRTATTQRLLLGPNRRQGQPLVSSLINKYPQPNFGRVFLTYSTSSKWNHSYLVSSPSLLASSPLEPARSYAKAKGGKGKKGEEESGGEGGVSSEEVAADIKSRINDMSRRTIDYVTEEFAKLRLGRANPEILSKVKVEGTLLTKKASVHAKDPHTLHVTPFDNTHMKQIMEALTQAVEGSSLIAEGNHIVLRLPKASGEHREALIKQATKMAEEGRVAIRRHRQTALNEAKKYKERIDKDSFKRIENEVQKLTDDYIKKIDQLLKTKEKDINQQ